MKILKTTMLIIALVTAVISCKKEDVSTPPAPGSGFLAGRWVGKFGFTNENPDTYYSFKLKADGTLDELNSSNEKIGEGTWTLNGTTFTAKHHYISGNHTSFTDVATYHAATNSFSDGTWGYSSSSTDGGKWFMAKQ